MYISDYAVNHKTQQNFSIVAKGVLKILKLMKATEEQFTPELLHYIVFSN